MRSVFFLNTIFQSREKKHNTKKKDVVEETSHKKASRNYGARFFIQETADPSSTITA